MYVRMLEIVPATGQEPLPEPTKSVNVKMPKLIAMAVPWIRPEMEAKEPEAGPGWHFKELELVLVL